MVAINSIPHYINLGKINSKVSNMKIISLFNHKGGVSKTTTTFNLGWMLAEKGYKTLIVDADPQCNLTALVLDYNSVDDIEGFYQENNGCDLASGLDPIMFGNISSMKPGNPVATSNKNLFLYCGNLKMSDFETQIGVALTTGEAIPAIKNIPGSLNYLLRETAKHHNFDFVLIDMSPNVGALNHCLLMSSDFFVIPTTPDFFCAQAIKSLNNVLPKWNNDIQKFRTKNLNCSFPENPPKFLGFISQRYRPRDGSPAKSFQRWIDVINQDVNGILIPTLLDNNMTITLDNFKAGTNNKSAYNMANISDFNSLIAQSQKFNTPIFALTEQQIEQSGKVLDTMVENRDNFREVFSGLADDIICLTNF